MNSKDVTKDVTKEYRNSKGELHRDNDMPTIIDANGNQLWYQNGKRHRDNDMPAIIDAE